MFVSQLALEKEELRIHLQASKQAQRQLTAEVTLHTLMYWCTEPDAQTALRLQIWLETALFTSIQRLEQSAQLKVLKHYKPQFYVKAA